MSKFVLYFTKTGYVKYTSHLDMIRLFKRIFKRSGLDLEHSQGYNPHPKMVFAQPLSLGFSSIGEILEFSTIKDFSEQDIEIGLKNYLPNGMDIVRIEEKNSGKTVASKIRGADYLIVAEEEPLTEDIINKFLEQKEIPVPKRKKKKVGRRGKKITEIIEIDIKPLIKSLKLIKREDILKDTNNKRLIKDPQLIQIERLNEFFHNFCYYDTVILASLNTGSDSNLNPELLLKALGQYSNRELSLENCEIMRLSLNEF